MQTTVTTAEAAANLSTLIEKAGASPILIREGDENVALIYSLKPTEKTEEERDASWYRLSAMSRQVSTALEADLARDGLILDEFLTDALSDV